MVPATRYNRPLSTMRSLLDDFFTEPYFRLRGRDITGSLWPRIDISEEDKTYRIRADLPGMKKEDIDVSIEGDTLTISGTKVDESREEEGKYSHYERSYGNFERSFTIPDNVDSENVSASYKNGVLELELTKTAESKTKGKKIEVKTE